MFELKTPGKRHHFAPSSNGDSVQQWNKSQICLVVDIKQLMHNCGVWAYDK